MIVKTFEPRKSVSRSTSNDAALVSKREQLTADELEEIYHWVDQVPLSRRKRNILRDFSDGCMMAELLKYFLPKGYKRMVDTDNYVPTNTKAVKINNWDLLNQKVLKRINPKCEATKEEILGIVEWKQGCIERVLKRTQIALAAFIEDPDGEFRSPRSVEPVPSHVALRK